MKPGAVCKGTRSGTVLVARARPLPQLCPVLVEGNGAGLLETEAHLETRSQ